MLCSFYILKIISHSSIKNTYLYCIVSNFQYNMNSSRIHKIMALVQKYEILEYLTFIEF